MNQKSHCRAYNRRLTTKRQVGGWTETRPVSLGLLPSGPDPVGEWCVHRQPPSIYLDRPGEFRNRLECSSRAAAGTSCARLHGIGNGVDPWDKKRSRHSYPVFPSQGARVKGSFRDEACDEVVVSCGGFTLMRGAGAGAGSLRRRHSASRTTVSIIRGKPFPPAERARTSGPGAPARNANGVSLRARFPLDPAAGFVRCRLTGTKN